MIPKYWAVKGPIVNTPFWNWFKKNCSKYSNFAGNTNYYYGVNRDLDITCLTHKNRVGWHPETVFFESPEEFMKLVEEKPRRSVDSIGNKEVIYCPTQKEWDAICELFKLYNLLCFYYNSYKEESCINPNIKQYGNRDFYTAEGYTVIPASDFLINSTKPEMKTYTVPHSAMAEIYKISCTTWKKKIEEWTNPFTDTTLTQEQVDEMFQAASKAQTIILSKFFKREATLDDLRGYREHFAVKGVAGMIQIRDSGNYQDKGYYLYPEFNWEIKKDDRGISVLIPTRKN